MRTLKAWSIACLTMATVARASWAQSRASIARDTALESLVASVIDSSMAAEHIPGVAVIVVRDGAVVYSKGFGLANLERRTPVDPATTRFRIGSISKALTSLAVLQLVDRGRVGLDDPVHRWIPELPIESRFTEPVRVRHLVTHTAGFDQLGDSGRYTFTREERWPIERFLRGHLRVVRSPGLASSYDKQGMTLAGYLVERVSGMPYAEYMRRNVFAPLGMSNTSVETPDSLRESLATGYAHVNDAFKAQAYEYYATTPASSIDATVDDMGRLMVALLDTSGARARGFLSRAALRRLWTPQFSNYPGIPAYTFGFWEDSVNGERVIQHGGNMLEYEGQLVLVPARRLGFYVVYNHDGEAGGPHTQLRNTLMRRLLDFWLPPLSVVAAPNPLPIDTKRFAGFYATGVYCHTCRSEGMGWNFDYYRIESAGPGMLAIGSSRWIAVDSTLFVSARDPRRKLGFQVDASGAVRRSVIGTDVRERLDETLIDEVYGPAWRDGPPLAFAARVYRTSEQWPSCVDANAALARVDSLNGRMWYYGGFCAIRMRAFPTAIASLTRAYEVGPWFGPAAVQLAVAYAESDSVDRAFEWMQRAGERRSLTRRTLDNEPAFARLRSDPRFAELRAKVP